MKLDSVPPFPSNLVADGIPTNMVMNKTKGGRYQIARVLKGGGADESDFDVLFTGQTQEEAREFWLAQVDKDFPGLLQQQN